MKKYTVEKFTLHENFYKVSFTLNELIKDWNFTRFEIWLLI